MCKNFDTAAFLQPTSPLRTSADIISGYNLLHKKNANAVVGVYEVEHSPLWCNTLPEDLSLRNFINKDLIGTPRKSLPIYYRINGALYISKIDYLNSSSHVFEERCYAHLMNQRNSIDIGNEMDFIIAETLLKYDQ